METVGTDIIIRGGRFVKNNNRRPNQLYQYSIILIRRTLFNTSVNTYVADIDECTAKDDSCTSNAECINTAGSYECRCTEGYTGDANHCEGNLKEYLIDVTNNCIVLLLNSSRSMGSSNFATSNLRLVCLDI